jgi:cysteine-rich repeat protein
MRIVRVVIGAAVVSLAVLVGMSMATDSPATKASRACRKTIGSAFSKIVSAGIGAIDGCHGLRDKDKFTGDCNNLVDADIKSKVASAHTAATKNTGKKCLAGDPVLANYPSNDPVGAFFPLAVDVIQASGGALLGAPDIHKTKADKARAACHAAIAKAAAKNINEILKGAVKCQNTVDKTATQFGSLQSDCLLAPTKSAPKGELAIGKKCVDLGIAGIDVGSCDPLPTCVTASSKTTGQQTAAAIYNPNPGCGNSFVESGEECDDGNDISTDGCISCTLATCGDGFVHAGVELCGDSPPAACQTPNENTCGSIAPCVPDGQMQSATVRFSKPPATSVLGLSIALDYPEANVRIPGTGSAQAVRDRVTVIPQNGLITVTDRDYEVEVTIASADPLVPGDFFTVQFDECTVATLDQFGCNVRSAGDGLNDVTAQVSCSVTVP